MWFAVVALVPIALIACMIRAWRPPTLLELLVLFVMYTLSGLGISLGWHRLFTHLGFKCKPPLRTALALAGSLAAEGSLASWVANHRQHHAHTDAPGDPHSPHLHSSRLRGFLHAHLGWLRFSGADPSVSAREILTDPVLSAVSRWWWVWTLVGVFLPPLVASTFAGFSVFWGLCLWAGLFASSCFTTLLGRSTRCVISTVPARFPPPIVQGTSRGSPFSASASPGTTITTHPPVWPATVFFQVRLMSRPPCCVFWRK